jgi:type IV secretory pathway TrbD component
MKRMIAFSLGLGLAVSAVTTTAFGSRLWFEQHAAVQESLARVHPRMRAMAV